MSALSKSIKEISYGIRDFSCRRIDDGTLRANHSGLFEPARMVTLSLRVNASFAKQNPIDAQSPVTDGRRVAVRKEH